MENLVQIGRVVIIADTVLEKRLLEDVLRLGAKGYNCHYCAGKGRHEILEDPYNGRSRVKIEVLAPQEVAEAILAYVHKKPFGRYPVAAYLDTVEVLSRDTFF